MASEAHRFVVSIATNSVVRTQRTVGWTASRKNATSWHGRAKLRLAGDGLEFVLRLRKEIERLGVSEADWCRGDLGLDIRTMRRRVQLANGCVQHDERVGTQETRVSWSGIWSFESSPSRSVGQRKVIVCPVVPRRSCGAGRLDLTRCGFVSGDALTELPADRPLKGGTGHDIGLEPTVAFNTYERRRNLMHRRDLRRAGAVDRLRAPLR